MSTKMKKETDFEHVKRLLQEIKSKGLPKYGEELSAGVYNIIDAIDNLSWKHHMDTVLLLVKPLEQWLEKKKQEEEEKRKKWKEERKKRKGKMIYLNSRKLNEALEVRDLMREMATKIKKDVERQLYSEFKFIRRPLEFNWDFKKNDSLYIRYLFR